MLDDDSAPDAMQTLEAMELTVRQKIPAHVTSKLGNFLFEQLQQQQGDPETLGALEMTTKQAQKLKVLPHRQVSPYLENCC
jgi:hypothetical protein